MSSKQGGKAMSLKAPKAEKEEYDENLPPRRSIRMGGRTGSSSNNNDNDGENPNIAEMIAQQLAALVPTIVTQVTAAMLHGNNNNGGDGGNNNNGGDGDNNNNGCKYKDFLACKPKEFDGKGGALVLTRWIEKMESVMDISNCADNQKVKYATSSLINEALTWWNTQIEAKGRVAAIGMTWEEFKALLKEEFCPSYEMQKLEHEFWNHSMVGANHAAYTDRFHELAKLVPHLVTPESKRIERYIYGLVPQIRGTVAATEPPTIQSAILKTGALTDEMVRNGSLPKSSEKRKDVGETSKKRRTNGDNKKAKVVKGFVATNPVKEYIGLHPKCARCNYHHLVDVPCRTCQNCNRLGHFAKDCRAVVRQVAPVNAVNPAGNLKACYGCGSPDHYRNVCPSRLNKAPKVLAIRGNQNQGDNDNQARGRAFIMGANEAHQDPNIVTGRQGQYSKEER